jgi:hypothetical protein
MIRISIQSIITIIIALLSVNNLTAQTDVPNATFDGQYYQAAKKFLHYTVRHERTRKETFLLQDSIAMDSDLLRNCLRDSVTFTPQEQNLVRAWAAQPPIHRWTNDLIPGVRLISKDSINAIFAAYHPGGGWDYIHDHYGPRLNGFGCPLFLRNNTYCLFYYEYGCGSLCGFGSLVLYKKKGSRWIRVKDWGTWMS